MDNKLSYYQFLLTVVIIAVLVLANIWAFNLGVHYKMLAESIAREAFTRAHMPRPGVRKQGLCIDVITSAKNIKTGETKDFSTPCDVPGGWIKL